MKLLTQDFSRCLVVSVSTSHFSEWASLTTGVALPWKRHSWPPLHPIHHKPWGIQLQQQYIELHYFMAARDLNLAVHASVSFILEFCYMHDLGLALRVVKKGRSGETASESFCKQRQLTKATISLLRCASVFTDSSRELLGFIYKWNRKSLSSDKEKGARNNKVGSIIVWGVAVTSKGQAGCALEWPKYSYWTNLDRGIWLNQKGTWVESYHHLSITQWFYLQRCFPSKWRNQYMPSNWPFTFTDL